MEVAGKVATGIFTGPKQISSQDDSTISSCLLLKSSLLHPISATTATTSDQRGSDRRDRCASEDRGMSSRGCGLMSGNSMIPKPIPRPEPIEINVDFERILPPVEYCDAAVAAKTVIV